MAMYATLSKFYHYIFPAREPQLTFFKKNFLDFGVKKVIDIACGTGEYTREFAAWGMEAHGIDCEEEMIEIAQQRAKKEGLAAFFKVGDMTELPYKDEEFHCAICIGNSLVHLLERDKILQVLREMKRVVTDGGPVIIQIVNYDRILNNRITELPPIKNDATGITFERYYGFRDDGNIDFSTILSINEDSAKGEYRNTIVLKPLLKEQLRDLLQEAGFKSPDFYGNFKGEPWSQDSFATVVKAIR